MQEKCQFYTDPEPATIDVAYVEYAKGSGWTIHYRMFIEWGYRCVVCEGSNENFINYDSAIGWLFEQFPLITIVSKNEFLTERKGITRFG